MRYDTLTKKMAPPGYEPSTQAEDYELMSELLDAVQRQRSAQYELSRACSDDSKVHLISGLVIKQRVRRDRVQDLKRRLAIP